MSIYTYHDKPSKQKKAQEHYKKQYGNHETTNHKCCSNRISFNNKYKSSNLN